MYTIVLATVLTAGNAAPAADIHEDIRDLKRSVEELRQDQRQFRTEELKQIIAGLRQRLTDEKLDELRRDIRVLKYEEVIAEAGPGPLPMPGATRLEPLGHRAVVSLQAPAGATLSVDGREIALLEANPAFVTPPLEPGKDCFYDFKVTVVEDGKTVIRAKRVTVRAGGMVRLSYGDMEAPR